MFFYDLYLTNLELNGKKNKPNFICLIFRILNFNCIHAVFLLLQKSPAVKVTHFKGCMGEASLNGKSIGLWNYIEREGKCSGCFGRYFGLVLFFLYIDLFFYMYNIYFCSR